MSSLSVYFRFDTEFRCRVSNCIARGYAGVRSVQRAKTRKEEEEGTNQGTYVLSYTLGPTNRRPDERVWLVFRNVLYIMFDCVDQDKKTQNEGQSVSDVEAP
jgi:hypothetical protein